MTADEWREILDQIPAPLERLLFLKCPRCGHRTWNCHGAERLGYQAHYMTHLIEDLKREPGGRIDHSGVEQFGSSLGS